MKGCFHHWLLLTGNFAEQELFYLPVHDVHYSSSILQAHWRAAER